MKMSIMNRVLLTIYTLVILVLSLAVLAVGVGVIPLESAADYVSGLEYGWQFVLAAVLGGLIMLAISLKLLFSGSSQRQVQSSLLKNTELGVIRVSQTTLDTLAQKAVREFKEVKDVKTLIVMEEDGIRVQIKLMVMPEVNIPSLTESIQTKIKNYIETWAGIMVKGVPIYVENLSTPNQLRVE